MTDDTDDNILRFPGAANVGDAPAGDPGTAPRSEKITLIRPQVCCTHCGCRAVRLIGSTTGEPVAVICYNCDLPYSSVSWTWDEEVDPLDTVDDIPGAADVDDPDDPVDV